MADLTYIEPIYITYEMIKNQLIQIIKVNEDPDNLGPNGIGMYIGDVKTYMAEGESFILKTILSNYVALPLTALDGGDFNSLLDNPAWRDTYIQVRALFCNAAYYYIYLNYFSEGGTNNGQALMKTAVAQINYYRNSLLRLDQAGNPTVKNAFVGLKKASNGSRMIPGKSRVPPIPLGLDQAYAAFNSTPDLRYGFNR